MEKRTIEYRRISESFLNRWPLERIKKMVLSEYVGIENKNTFCYSVERGTVRLGSIRGWSSIKFGIYERRDKDERPGKYSSDDSYSWDPSLDASDRNDAFLKVKAAIISIIKAAQVNDLELIDRIQFNHLMKWKIAALYSGEQIIPIFKQHTLYDISQRLGLNNSIKQSFATIYQYLFEKKPVRVNIYKYASDLLDLVIEDREPNYYIIGSKYNGNQDMFPLMLENQVVSMGFGDERDFSSLFGSNRNDIRAGLDEYQIEKKEKTALTHFLQLKPGDRIAVKSDGSPKGSKPYLRIIAYAIVVQRDDKIYDQHEELGQCVQVEYFQIDLDKVLSIGGFASTIHQITEERIDDIFGDFQNDISIQTAISERRRRRRSSSIRSVGDQLRNGSEAYVAKMTHNKIQEKFYTHLLKTYDENQVCMEENNVDIKLTTDREVFFYEVKPYAFPEDCIRQALGQLLTYVHFDNSTLEKKLRVIGPNPPNSEEIALIEYIKNNMLLDFDYIAFDMS